MLNPGDRVIELAGVVISSAVVTGAVVSAWIIWLIKKSWLAAAGALFAGAIIGFMVAQFVAHLLYRTADGQTTVAKVGPPSLSVTIPAGLTGGITTAVVVTLGTMLLFGAKGQELIFFGIAIGCGVILGILLACLGSLA